MELIMINKENYSKIQFPLIATIGQFDGLHLAHLLLIEKTIKIANEKGVKSAMFTFHPHPDFILNKDDSNTYVTPLDEKISFLNEMGLDCMIIIEFDEEVAKMSPKKFIEDILIKNCVKEVVVGFDFSFGRNGEGKASMINDLSNGEIECHIIEEVKYENKKIGTTLIKSLLKRGRVGDVAKIMGRFYKITGKVVYGNQVGRTINFPTANFHINSSYAKLHPGVYVVRVSIDGKKYLGIANLGNNPSFNKVDNMVFETHIFDFNQNIYGEDIVVELVEFIRDEVHFPSKEKFIEQIKKDANIAKNISNNLNLIKK